MPNYQAIEQLSTAIADAFNNMLPEPTTPEMQDAMDDIRTKNTQLASTIANAINVFIGRQTIQMNLSWTDLRPLILDKLGNRAFINHADIQYCVDNPYTTRGLSHGTRIEVNQSGGTESVTLVQHNAII